MACQVEDVEDIINQAAPACPQVVLKELKIRPSRFVEDHDLAVEKDVERELLQGIDDRLELAGEGLVMPGIEADRVLSFFGDGPVAVPFYLEEPSRTVEGRIDKGGLHRLDIGGDGGLGRSGKINGVRWRAFSRDLIHGAAGRDGRFFLGDLA